MLVLSGYEVLEALFLAGTSVHAGIFGHRTSIILPPPPPNSGAPNGESRQGVLYLFQKTPADGPWPVVHGGAWGVLRYNLWARPSILSSTDVILFPDRNTR
jgi:hypothetical protein